MTLSLTLALCWLALANIINMAGVLIMTVILLRMGGIARRGRAVLLAL